MTGPFDQDYEGGFFRDGVAVGEAVDFRTGRLVVVATTHEWGGMSPAPAAFALRQDYPLEVRAAFDEEAWQEHVLWSFWPSLAEAMVPPRAGPRRRSIFYRRRRARMAGK